MARRIEVELTSSREDGAWTWRAAGARQPKGELDGGLLYPGAKVGDVVKVEAEFHLDGIEVTTVFPPKEAKGRTDLLEMVSRPPRDDELVTTTRVARRDSGDRDDRRRGPRRPGGPRSEDRGGRGDGGRRREGAGDRERPHRQPRPEPEARPKPKRLRARRAHRDAVMADVPEEYRPIAERLLAGGLPEVRKALDEQNAAAKASGGPELAPGPILTIAEELNGRLRTAEWRDRADAALADLDELDLRDLRSVVVAADAAARDDESRALAEQLREGLNRRVEADHGQWMADLTAAVHEGRVVRALRLSSRPVKAGAPLPPELAATLAEMASAALAPDISQDRWATVLDAVAFSPVRGAIHPAGIPSEPGPELREAVTKVADRVPHIAALFGVDPAEAGRSRTRTRRARTRKPEGDRTRGRTPAPAPGAADAGSAPPTPPVSPAPDGEAVEAVPAESMPTPEAVPAESTPTPEAVPAEPTPTPEAVPPESMPTPEAEAAGTEAAPAEPATAAAEAGAAGADAAPAEPATTATDVGATGADATPAGAAGETEGEATGPEQDRGPTAASTSGEEDGGEGVDPPVDGDTAPDRGEQLLDDLGGVPESPAEPSVPPDPIEQQGGASRATPGPAEAEGGTTSSDPGEPQGG